MSILKVDQIQLSNGNTPTAGDLGINDTGTVLQYKLCVLGDCSPSCNYPQSNKLQDSHLGTGRDAA